MYAVKSLERDGIEGFVQMAKTADVLIACIPLTAETASIIDEKVIDPSPYPPHHPTFLLRYSQVECTGRMAFEPEVNQHPLVSFHCALFSL
jgi:hypothetical protein